MNYQTAKDLFLDALVRAPATLDAYARGIDLFVESWQPQALETLGPGDAMLLNRFAQWLLAYRQDDGSPYATATMQLYLRAVRRWFEWLGINGHLPAAFPLPLALHNLDDSLRGGLFRVDRQPPEPPDMQRILDYYAAGVSYPVGVEDNPDLKRRWLLTGFRNQALVHTLADSGGRISEVLSLNVGDFPPEAFVGGLWRAKVVGKGRREYWLWLRDALPRIKTYLQARQLEAELEDGAPLFVNHLRYIDRRMSRQAAGHVVRDAARALGMGAVGPHDFRHWKATQMRNAGVPVEDIAFVLGHRSLQTTKDYYAHVELVRVAGVLGALD